jgi:hypothetical protein
VQHLAPTERQSPVEKGIQRPFHSAGTQLGPLHRAYTQEAVEAGGGKGRNTESDHSCTNPCCFQTVEETGGDDFQAMQGKNKERARHGRRAPTEWQGLLIEMSYTASVSQSASGAAKARASYLVAGR